MKNLYCLSLIILFINVSYAQIDTTNFIYQLDFSTYTDTFPSGQKSSILIKMIQEKEFDELGIAYIVDRLIDERKIVIYKDEYCIKTFSEYEFPFSTQGEIYDSIFQKLMRNESLTQEENLQLIRKPRHQLQILFPTDQTLFQFTQHWNFDTATQKLSNSIQKTHIGYYSYYEKNVFKRLFSIKNKPSTVQNIQTELAKPSVIWAKQIEYEMLLNDSLQYLLVNEKHFAANKIVDKRGQPVTTEQAVYNYFDGRDTVIAINPETFEEELAIAFHCYDNWNNDYNTFKIVQDIYFDVSTNSFNTKILAIAPMRAMYDYLGNYLFHKYSFWIVYDDDFLKTFSQ